jgi:hypothetical protein
MLKILAVAGISGILLTSAPAQSQSIEAKGVVTYKMPSGEIVQRPTGLEVPSRGQGDVILRGGSSEFVADRFFTRQEAGRSVFYVVFKNFPGAELGDMAVYRGTYLRGTNLALYYGDVYKGKDADQTDDTIHTMLTSLDQGDYRYVAGFYFESKVTRP